MQINVNNSDFRIKSINCVICKINIRDFPSIKPVLRSCGHLMCHGCLVRSPSILCPRCPDDSVDITNSKYFTHIFVQGLLARPRIADQDEKAFKFKKMIKTQPPIKSSDDFCIECTDIGSCKCLQCKFVYCKTCFRNVHQFKTNGNHVNVPLNNELSNICMNHEYTICDYWCTDCNKSCCSQCIEEDHHSHSYGLIKALNEGLKLKLEDAYNNVADTLQRVICMQKKYEDASKEMTLDDIEEYESDIDDIFIYLHGVMQNLHIKMKGKLHEPNEIKKKKVGEILEKLKTTESQLQNGLKLATCVKENSDYHYFANVIEKLNVLANTPCFSTKQAIESKYTVTKKIDVAEIIKSLENHLAINVEFENEDDQNLMSKNDMPTIDRAESLSNQSVEIPKLYDSADDQSLLSTSVTPVMNASSTASLIKTSDKKRRSVVIEHIESPIEFWIQRENSSHLYEQLHEELMDLYNNNNFPSPKTVELNAIYAVFDDNKNKWYRGRIVSCDNFYCDAFAIDHGFTIKNIHYHYIKEIKGDVNILFIDPLVEKKSLFDIKPKSGSWTKESVDTMKKVLAASVENPILTTVTVGHQQGYDLLIHTDSYNTSMRDALIFLGHANFISKHRLYRVNAKASNALCYDLMKVGNYYNVKCLNVESMNCIYVAKNDYDSSALNNMHQKMTVHYQTIKKYNPTVYCPEIGMSVAVPQKTHWCRGIISDIPEPGFVEVFLVDFGEKVKLNYKKISFLNSNFTKITTKAIKVRLNEASEQASNEEIKNYIVEFMNPTAQVLAMKKLDDGSYVVNIQGKNNEYLNHALQQSGFIPSTLKQKKKSEKIKKQVVEKKKISPKDKGKSNQMKFSKRNPYKVYVKIIHMESPSNICVTLLNQHEKFDDIQSQMQKFYTTHIVDGNWEFKEKILCAVYLPRTKLYYRAIIKKIISDDEIIVNLCDIGTSETVNKSQLQALDLSLYDKNALAFKIQLGGIIPSGGSKQWTFTACRKLREILDEKDNRLFSIVKINNSKNVNDDVEEDEKDEEDEALCVDLFIEKNLITDALAPTTVSEFNVNKMLIDEGVALPIKDFEKVMVLAVDVEREIIHNRLDNDSDDDDDDEEDDDDDKNEDESNQMQVINTSGDESMLILPDDEKVREIFPAHNRESTFSPEIEKWLPAEMLTVQEFPAFVTNVDWNGFVYLYPLKIGDAAKNILLTLNKEYENSVSTDDDRFWTPGERCIVQYHHNNMWCRGVIHEVELSKIAVEFVDFGNIEWQSPTSLRKKLMFEDVPRIVSKCVLYGIKPAAKYGKWSVRALDKLHGIIVDKNCNVKIIDKKSDHYVIVIDRILDIDKSLLDRIIEKDFENDFIFDSDLYNYQKEHNYDEAASDDDEAVSDDDESYPSLNSNYSNVNKSVANELIRSTNACSDPDNSMLLSSNAQPSTSYMKPSISDLKIEVRPSSSSSSSCLSPALASSDQSLNADDEDDDNTLGNNIDEFDESFFDDTIYESQDFNKDVREIEEKITTDDYNYNSIFPKLIWPLEAVKFSGSVGQVSSESPITMWVHPHEVLGSTEIDEHINNYRRKIIPEMAIESFEQPLLTNFEIGTACCAIFGCEENAWYRAKIVGPVNSITNTVEVEYVDYGNRDVVDIYSLRSMKPEWAKTPALAVKVQLWNIKVNYDDPVAIQCFFENFVDVELSFVIKEYQRDRLFVEIYEDTFDECINVQRRLIYQDLIDCGNFQRIFH